MSEVALALQILQAAVALIADIVRAGKDPVTEITRIRDARPWLDEVEREWAERIDAK